MFPQRTSSPESVTYGMSRMLSNSNTLLLLFATPYLISYFIQLPNSWNQLYWYALFLSHLPNLLSRTWNQFDIKHPTNTIIVLFFVPVTILKLILHICFIRVHGILRVSSGNIDNPHVWTVKSAHPLNPALRYHSQEGNGEVLRNE